MSDILNNIQEYGKTPTYIQAQSSDDRLNIMFCEILTWTPIHEEGQEPDWWTIKNSFRLTEVGSIEVKKSYKEIISKATITLPRGTVIGYKIDEVSRTEKVSAGNNTDADEETNFKIATQYGDTIPPGVSEYKNGDTVLALSAIRADDGTIIVSQATDTGVATINEFAVGNRIEIRLAYAYDEEEYDLFLTGKQTAKMVFTGFITKCSVNTPLKIECEDMMSVLKRLPCPNHVAKRNYTVNDYLSRGGTFDLLKGSGLYLDTKTLGTTIHVGKVNMTNDLVVADVLDEWSKCGLYCFMNEDWDCKRIRVGQVYTSGIHTDNNNNVIIAEGSVNIIQFDWDVANDGLTVMKIDKRYLAIECSGMVKDGKFIKFTLRKSTDGGFDIVNENYNITKRAGKKQEDKSTSTKNSKLRDTPKKSLDNYTKVSYISATNPVTREKLIEEGKAYYEMFNPNGVSGKLTIFGDRNIKPTQTVGLVDPRHPERNGWYFVSEVTTTFSVSGGYRQELSLPYKLGEFKPNVEIIR